MSISHSDGPWPINLTARLPPGKHRPSGVNMIFLASEMVLGWRNNLEGIMDFLRKTWVSAFFLWTNSRYTHKIYIYFIYRYVYNSNHHQPYLTYSYDYKLGQETQKLWLHLVVSYIPILPPVKPTSRWIVPVESPRLHG
jgi:hypothetical protein